MPLIFANPLGWLALLAVPAILAIHFLQRRRTRLPVSTFFLLPFPPADSVRGRAWHRLRHSPSLWMQLLCAVLLAVLLADPRVVREDSFQRIVVVLDDSLSMRAVQAELWNELAPRLNRKASGVAATEWLFLTSTTPSSRMYSGGDLRRAAMEVDTWLPSSGVHDPGRALNDALSLVQSPGSVVFVTDRPRTELPAGVHVLSIGRPLENIGFLGAQTMRNAEGIWSWRALVRNYGTGVATTSWWVEDEHGRGSTAQPLRLEPGQASVLEGVFPAEADHLALRVADDAFPWDNFLPLVRPAPKMLRSSVQTHPAHRAEIEKLLGVIEGMVPARAGELVEFAVYSLSASRPLESNIPSILLLDEQSTGAAAAPVSPGPLVADHHPWTAGLSFQGLLVETPSESFPVEDGDQVVVYLGSRPLIFLRGNGLWVNFDPARSNAFRHPGFLLLLKRHMEHVRDDRVAPYRANFHTGQILGLRADALGGEVVMESASGSQRHPAPQAAILRAPTEPGFFRVSQGEHRLLEGAAHHADPRPGDFRTAATFEEDPTDGSDLLRRHSESLPTKPVWLCLVAALMLAGWHFTGRDR